MCRIDSRAWHMDNLDNLSEADQSGANSQLHSAETFTKGSGLVSFIV